MFNTKAFYGSRAGTPALQNIAGLADPLGGVSGNLMTVPDQTSNLLALAVVAQTATAGGIVQAQFRAPSFENINLDIRPIIDTATASPIFPSPTPITNFRYNPIPLTRGEEVQMLSANSGTNVEDALVAVFLTDGRHNPIPADWKITTIRTTTASTAVANTWSNSALVVSQSLKAGYYAVVGMRYESAGAQLARLVFSGMSARPGCIGYNTIGKIEDAMFRHGGLGVWGYFSHRNVPTLDLLSDSADAAGAPVYLDLVYLGTDAPAITGVLTAWGF